MEHKMTNEQITIGLQTLDDWKFTDGFLTKSLKFKNFKETFSIMTQIAFECEHQGHHPNWENVYNNLTIRLNTHDVGGITEKDFVLAKSIDTITAGR
ncbi:Putative pterin-4-alpha-carbinolamine dehydratase [Croceitalea dokdonensis DOKDO 023]|uniref:Putative pterin-4-alpha-carbinolamine dehydratase n=1 Tax=Croceitalea dokdonensis DOKDO 023 TaxID=1300341 RepID=A0A0P7AYN2_9FLAO|nr:4a-hydroxytetrahydrobiopterin dehydratase [Croceitalea dokdonensis]KPM30577.1 Putative pterin-4-alpha-carbinolamine dehydratase [Croceitalea dokdonensis DOKDO 023]